MSRWSIEAAAAAVGAGAGSAVSAVSAVHELPGAGGRADGERPPADAPALARTASRARPVRGQTARQGEAGETSPTGPGGQTGRSGLPWLDRWARGLRTSLRPQQLALGALEADADAADAACAAFADWCARHAGSRLHLGLGAALVQICVAPAALAQAELRDYASRQLAHYFGRGAGASEGGGWTVAASSQPDVPLACAAPRALVAGLQAAARAHGVRLIALGPWWARSAQAWLLQAPPGEEHTRVWLAREPGWVTVLQARGRVLQRAWSEPQDGEWQQRLPRDVQASAIAGIDLAAAARPTPRGGADAAGGAGEAGEAVGRAWLAAMPEPAR